MRVLAVRRMVCVPRYNVSHHSPVYIGQMDDFAVRNVGIWSMFPITGACFSRRAVQLIGARVEELLEQEANATHEEGLESRRMRAAGVAWGA